MSIKSKILTIFILRFLFFFFFCKQKPEQVKPQPPHGAKLIRRPTPKAIATKTTTQSDQTANASGTMKKSASAIAAAQKREAQRKQLLEMKRKNKLAMTTSSNIQNDDFITDCQTVNKQCDQIKSNANETTTTDR